MCRSFYPIWQKPTVNRLTLKTTQRFHSVRWRCSLKKLFTVLSGLATSSENFSLRCRNQRSSFLRKVRSSNSSHNKIKACWKKVSSCLKTGQARSWTAYRRQDNNSQNTSATTSSSYSTSTLLTQKRKKASLSGHYLRGHLLHSSSIRTTSSIGCSLLPLRVSERIFSSSKSQASHLALKSLESK